MNSWLMPLLSLFPTTIVGALIVYFVKDLVSKSLDAQLQNHKAALDKDVKEFELRLSNQLNKLSFEYQTKFSTFHQKEVEVIGEVYGRLANAHSPINQLLVKQAWTVDEETQKSLVDSALKSIREFENYYRAHRIYLDHDICDKLDSLHESISKANQSYVIAKSTRSYDIQRGNKLFEASSQELKEKAQPILNDLETEFRKKLAAKTE